MPRRQVNSGSKSKLFTLWQPPYKTSGYGEIGNDDNPQFQPIYWMRSMDGTHNEMPKYLRRQLTSILVNGHEQRRKGKYSEMEKTAAIDNSHNFYRLLMSAGPRKPIVSERWSRRPTQTDSPSRSSGRALNNAFEGTVWLTLFDLCLQMKQSIRTGDDLEDRLSERHKAVGRERLSPPSYFETDKMLTSELTKLVGSVWAMQHSSKNWCESTIEAICKKFNRSSYGNL